MTTTAKVYIIGGGPGAADLITVRAQKILQQAQIIFYDALISDEILWLAPQAEKISVGKKCGHLSITQEEINSLLISASQKHQIIVRLKGGDPMIFGRADEEINSLLQNKINFEVVPGITTATAVAAEIQQSLTLRGVSRSIAFCTFTSHSNDKVRAPQADTLVIYMARKEAKNIAVRLQNEIPFWSKNTPVILMQSVSTKMQKSISLSLEELQAGFADNFLQSDQPTIMMVGHGFKL